MLLYWNLLCNTARWQPLRVCICHFILCITSRSTRPLTGPWHPPTCSHLILTTWLGRSWFIGGEIEAQRGWLHLLISLPQFKEDLRQLDKGSVRGRHKQQTGAFKSSQQFPSSSSSIRNEIWGKGIIQMLILHFIFNTWPLDYHPHRLWFVGCYPGFAGRSSAIHNLFESWFPPPVKG